MSLLGRRKGPRVFFLTKYMPKKGGNAYEFLSTFFIPITPPASQLLHDTWCF